MPGLSKSDRPRFGAGLLLGLLMLMAMPSVETRAASESCRDLQAMIDEAPAGATIVVPPCRYRTSLNIQHPITLRAMPGAIIDGSDVWSDWDGRSSRGVLPEGPRSGECQGVPACPEPLIVLLDGFALAYVDADPADGQFSLDAARHVVLGQDPSGHVVEIVVRRTWMVISASDVTVDGFTMRYAANGAQTGALQVEPGASRFTLRNCDLGYAAGANVAFGSANDSVVEDCDIHHAGQLGVHLGGDGTNGRDNVLRDSDIHDNNTTGFDPEWEAGGLKATRQIGLKLIGNTVSDNAGPGLWCDIYCHDIVVSGNRVHDNTHAGIFFEVSTGATINDNRVWENGWGKPSWGWGAGILISSSGGADVHHNIVAWNYAGISVISQDRQDWSHSATDNDIHDNTVIVEDDQWAVFWAQDWSGPLYETGSDNRGSANRYWFDHAEDGHARFAWRGAKSALGEFNATPAEEGGRYVSDVEKTHLLTDADMPIAPTVIHATRLPIAPMAAVAAIVALLAGGGVLLVRTVRRRG
jgi:parallel beta-helix repeat protein